MVTVISRFRVRNGFEDQVRAAFLAQPRLVENQADFCGLEVLTDASDRSVFLLITRWTSEAAFRSWHGSEAHDPSREFIPEGFKLDASFTQIVVGNRVEDPQGVVNLNDAIEGQTVALSRWLLESDTIFALLLGPDWTIRSRNHAANRIFPCDPAGHIDREIWDYVIFSDAESFRLQFSDPATRDKHPFRLNLSDGQSNPISVEVNLLDCPGGFLLLGAIEERHALRLQAERQMLTNQLATMARELSRKNKELEAANHAIETIARTDALTGLSNRRTFDELILQEIARANRQHQPLTLILADIDYFKRINDVYGHMVGDKVLSALGRIFGSQVRPYDVAARYGGEEFVLLFPGTMCLDGMAIAERLRKQVGLVEIPGCPERVTISVGVAAWMANESAEAFLLRTDAALYRAKDGGRNRVEADGVGVLQS